MDSSQPYPDVVSDSFWIAMFDVGYESISVYHPNKARCHYFLLRGNASRKPQGMNKIDHICRLIFAAYNNIFTFQVMLFADFYNSVCQECNSWSMSCKMTTFLCFVDNV